MVLNTFDMREVIFLLGVTTLLSTATAFEDHAILNTGAKMPLVGYGTWQALDKELENALDIALQIGYRHIDTAMLYQNEHVIGKVLQKWFVSGNLKREEVFITTKLPLFANRPEMVPKYLNLSLSNLQLDYVDMYLIHVPFGILEGFILDEDGNIALDMSTNHKELWKAMELEFDAGRAKAIGLSNFNQSQIARVKATARIQPANLQIELQVYLQQKGLINFCRENGIVVTSFATLGSLGAFKHYLQEKPRPDLLENKVVADIAKKHGKTTAQVLLRYFVQQKIVVIPKSTNPIRMKQNFEVFDFELSADDMQRLGELDKGESGRLFTYEDFLRGSTKHPEYPFCNSK